MLLLYCMAEENAAAVLPPRGVRSAPVEVLRKNGLVCYFSRYETFAGGAPEELKQDALDFHWAVNHVFAKQTVIPFRFPTLVAAESDLEAFLDKHAAAYLADLDRLRDKVQMEVRINLTPAVLPAQGTGTAYLKAKFEATQKVVELENLMKSAAQADWRQRGNRHFALIPRGALTEFRDKINALGQATLRVSGPWPPSEFVNCYPEASGD
jgi:hypothetical protein